jgi:hypothetical protein
MNGQVLTGLRLSGHQPQGQMKRLYMVRRTSSQRLIIGWPNRSLLQAKFLGMWSSSWMQGVELDRPPRLTRTGM